MSVILQTVGLGFSYGDNKVMRDVHLKLAPEKWSP